MRRSEHWLAVRVPVPVADRQPHHERPNVERAMVERRLLCRAPPVCALAGGDGGEGHGEDAGGGGCPRIQYPNLEPSVVRRRAWTRENSERDWRAACRIEGGSGSEVD
jgi:hypothetical protein